MANTETKITVKIEITGDNGPDIWRIVSKALRGECGLITYDQSVASNAEEEN